MLLYRIVSIFQDAVLLSCLLPLLTPGPPPSFPLCAAGLADIFPNPLPTGFLSAGSTRGRLEGRRRAEGMTFLFVLLIETQGNRGQLRHQPLASFDTLSTFCASLEVGTCTNSQRSLCSLSTSYMASALELLVPVMTSTLPVHAVF